MSTVGPLLASSLVGIVIPLAAQSDLPPEVLLLSRIEHRAAMDLARIPDFTCRENIERSRGKDGKPVKFADRVALDVAEIAGHELFAWPGSHFEERPVSEMIGEGMAGTGEFITEARNLFLGNMAVIRYSGRDVLNGRPAVRYDFQLSAAFSGFSVTIGGATATVGERGSFWADPQNYDLLRVVIFATDIPEYLLLNMLSRTVDYQRVHLSTGDYLLPRTATTTMVLSTGQTSINQTDFTSCRQYTPESKISFGDSAAAQLPDRAPALDEVALPVGYTFSLRLRTRVSLEAAKIGDPVTAELASDFKVDKRLIAPKGATVSGRLRLLQKEGNVYTAGLEFTEMTFGNKHARFAASLVSTDSRYAPRQITVMNTKRIPEGDGSGSRTVTGILETAAPNLPGVGTFLIPAGVTELPRGMRMEWQIVERGN